MPVRPLSSPRASALGANDRRSAASRTRRRVSALTWSRPLIALDAVAMDTPARRATSVRVAARGEALPLWVVMRPFPLLPVRCAAPSTIEP